MIIVPRTIQILDDWETCQLKAYKDNDGTWHVGFGHGNANHYPPFVDEFTVLKDRDEAMKILVGELNEVYVPQLTKLLDNSLIKLTDSQSSALLDVGYNRGMGRLRDSIAFRFLQHPEVEYYKKWAARALVFSTVDRFIAGEDELAKIALYKVSDINDKFTPLDVAKDKKTGVERVHLGLTLRRIDDASLMLTKEN